MKSERVLDALGQVNDKYILEAAPGKLARKKSGWIKWAAIAACLCLAVYAGIRFMPAGSPSDADSELPLLYARFENGGMGFEGLMLYDISESGLANPWTEDMTFKTLPVYENLAYTDASGLPVYLSESGLLAFAEEIATRLGVDIISTEYDRADIAQLPQNTRLKGGEAYRLTADAGEYTITVYGNGSANVNFNTPDMLSAEYSFSLSSTSSDEAETTISMLMEKYSSLLNGNKPVIYTWCDYSFTGEQQRRYFIYEDDADPVQKILNYNFSLIGFTPSEEGGALSNVSLQNRQPCCMNKLGDYPIIATDAARKMLLDGEYITTVPEDCLPDAGISEDMIAKTELIYRTGNTNEVFMPYYRFYVALDWRGEPADGLEMYGAYYVPAVSGEYLTDFPVWGGSFN